MLRQSHLMSLESESIQIIREAVAEAENPVLLFSGGKDSTVLAHLAVKAFFPSRPPLPLLHVDSTWEFREVIEFRDRFASTHGFDLHVHHNEEGREKGINPIDHGDIYTSVMRTEALRQALDLGGYDVIFGGARRDEEATRAKERIVSVRGKGHTWEPRAQRPELWHLYNLKRNPEQTLRVYPLSNWTEQDLWWYLYLEEIALCPLYFAAPRPVTVQDGKFIVIDDAKRGDRIRLQADRTAMVRFRSLGCWPVTAALPSEASEMEAVMMETLSASVSERNGRISDAGSLESQKRQGYF